MANESNNPTKHGESASPSGLPESVRATPAEAFRIAAILLVPLVLLIIYGFVAK